MKQVSLCLTALTISSAAPLSGSGPGLIPDPTNSSSSWSFKLALARSSALNKLPNLLTGSGSSAKKQVIFVRLWDKQLKELLRGNAYSARSRQGPASLARELYCFSGKYSTPREGSVFLSKERKLEAFRVENRGNHLKITSATLLFRCLRWKPFSKCFLPFRTSKLKKINSRNCLCITENAKITDELILLAYNMKSGTSEVYSFKFFNVTKRNERRRRDFRLWDVKTYPLKKAAKWFIMFWRTIPVWIKEFCFIMQIKF